MFKSCKIVFFTILFVFSGLVYSQKIHDEFTNLLNWKPTIFIDDNKNGENKAIFNFDGVNYNRDDNYLPFVSITKLFNKNQIFEPVFKVLQTEIVTVEEESHINKHWKLKEDFDYTTNAGIGSEKKIITCEIIPFRKNSSGKIEKLVQYQLKWVPGSNSKNEFNQSPFSYVSNSVLSSGNWYKIAITKNGIYKIDANLLKALGINIDSLDPRTIKVFGNGGRILSEKNADFKYDDLIENAIYVSGENDGIFNTEDYLLFYGKGTHQWEYNSNNLNDLKFSYIKNYYSDTTYYYITTNGLPGKRILNRNSLNETENYTSTSFDDFAFHEVDASNLIKSGREFYGEYFDINNEYTFGHHVCKIFFDWQKPIYYYNI